MRILRVHNRYQHKGGEDVSFESEVKLLEAYGHNLRALVVTNDDISDRRSPIMSAKLAATTVWSQFGMQSVEQAIREFAPDIVHFNNTFPLISPSAYTVCRRHGLPVVQTLHNYRPMCTNSLFYRDGHVCEDCLRKLIPFPGVIHACYRNSRLQTAPVAAMIAVHRVRKTWSRDVDKFIAMTRFERDKFIEGGFPADKITIKPHFVYATQMPPGYHREGLLYVGRLTPDKGILMLLSAWEQTPSVRLTIAGDGPLAGEVRRAAEQHPNLHYVGQKSNREVHELMRQATLLIVTSQWYETFGRVAIEAFAQGTPVLASNIGAIGEVVTPGKTGLHFAPGDTAALADCIRWSTEHPEELRNMGSAALKEYQRLYTPERNYEMLMDIYHHAIEEASRRSTPNRRLSQGK